jgi:hypothetical protein
LTLAKTSILNANVICRLFAIELVTSAKSLKKIPKINQGLCRLKQNKKLREGGKVSRLAHNQKETGSIPVPAKKKYTRKPLTWEEYDMAMHKIIFKHGNVADALIEMITFSSGIKLEPLPQSIFIPRNIGRKLKPVIITRGKRGK